MGGQSSGCSSLFRSLQMSLNDIGVGMFSIDVPARVVVHVCSTNKGLFKRVTLM